MSSPHRHSRTSTPSWVIIRPRLLVSPTSTINDWFIGTIALTTFICKRFTQSCYNESTSDPSKRSTLCLANPNTYSPSKCDILVKILKFEVYLATIATIWIKSLDWLAVCKCNSFLFRLVLDAPPCNKA